MRPAHILVVFLALGIVSSIAYARRIAWVDTDKPPVLLEEALSLALADLKKETPQKEYYCVAASLAQTFSQGDWALRFASKDGSQIWINVASDKSITKSIHGFDY
jgi:hypothetical protein